jgi:rhodanese-related sulfurtransferase
MSSLAHLQPELSPREVADLLDRVQLVDVREPYEYEAGHIAGARHVELVQLPEEADSLDRDRPVVFYCRVGGRSAMATQAFRASGYDAHNMAGGLVSWAESGLPLEGAVAEH